MKRNTMFLKSKTILEKIKNKWLSITHFTYCCNSPSIVWNPKNEKSYVRKASTYNTPELCVCSICVICVHTTANNLFKELCVFLFPVLFVRLLRLRLSFICAYINSWYCNQYNGQTLQCSHVSIFHTQYVYTKITNRFVLSNRLIDDRNHISRYNTFVDDNYRITIFLRRIVNCVPW